MEIAELLYNKGLISYPRTETQKYKNENLIELIKEQRKSEEWGNYAEELVESYYDKNKENLMYTRPRYGKLDDKSHPPIHPVRYPKPDELSHREQVVYEFITRYFLACVSPDAKGQETAIELKIEEEEFQTKGIKIEDLGYLNIYKYDSWNEDTLPENYDNFDEGKTISFKDDEIKLESSKTSPPYFLAESDLINLMDKNGIGTDATIHEHIKTINLRGYVERQGSIFKPTLIGTALVKVYEHIGIELYKPYLRSQMERDMKEVAEGNKNLEDLFLETTETMKKIYDRVYSLKDKMFIFLSKYISENTNSSGKLSVNSNNNNNNNTNNNPNVPKGPESNTVCPCTKCNNSDLKIKLSRYNKFFLGCAGFPKCKTIFNIAEQPIKIDNTEIKCEVCTHNKFQITLNNDVKKIICYSCLTKEPQKGFIEKTYIYKSPNITNTSTSINTGINN